MIPGIGFSLQKEYTLPHSEIIPLLKKHGFSAVSPVWTEDCDIKKIVSCATENSLTVQSLHATHKGVALLWQPDSDGSRRVFDNIIRSIDDCAQFGIPILVMHGWSGLYYTFSGEPLDFRLFDAIVQHACDNGISIAFENLEGEEYLAALMSRYSDCRNIGYCWDSGHDNCYPHKTEFLKAYGNRLIMTHINDNLGLRDINGVPTGDDDLHYIPLDGVIDWDVALAELKNCRRQQTLNFELKTASHSTAEADLIYVNLPIEEFIVKAASRAREIAAKYAHLYSESI